MGDSFGSSVSATGPSVPLPSSGVEERLGDRHGRITICVHPICKPLLKEVNLFLKSHARVKLQDKVSSTTSSRKISTKVVPCLCIK